MNSKMLFEESVVGYNKRNYTYYESEEEDDYEEEDFYDHYEPYEEDFGNDEYETFNYINEEEEYKSSLIKKTTPFKKPKPLLLNSPVKSVEKSPKKPSSPSWWDTAEHIPEDKRIKNGILNYAALIPFSETLKQESQNQLKKRKKDQTQKGTQKGTQKTQKVQSQKGKKEEEKAIVQKPTRLCLSVIKKVKCYHGQCKFAHNYSDLKECNFGEKCKKIVVVKQNQDGTIELSNKDNAICTFKHAKESQASFLKRLPQQHTSPKK